MERLVNAENDYEALNYYRFKYESRHKEEEESSFQENKQFSYLDSNPFEIERCSTRKGVWTALGSTQNYIY
jgi:hypothetical protein